MKQVLQPGFESPARIHQKDRRPYLRVGRVFNVNAAQNTVDVAFMDGSGVCLKVPVLSTSGNTMSGLNYHLNPYLKSEDDNLPQGSGKRDLYAVIAYIHGLDATPVVLGFKTPDFHQLSFPNGTGFENHYIDRHPSDRYHRIVGDTVAEMGGTDAPTEEELYWPDGSYFKIYHSTPALTELTGQNEDHDVQPFRLKSEAAKGFYFQHASGAIVKIDPSGDIQIKHPSGSLISMATATTGATAQVNPNSSVESANNPPTTPSADPIQVHIEHSSGTTLNVNADGDMEVSGATTINIQAVSPLTLGSQSSVTITDGYGTTVGLGADGNYDITGPTAVNIVADTAINLTAPSIVLSADSIQLDAASVTINGAQVETV